MDERIPAMTHEFYNELHLADFDRLLARVRTWVEELPPWPAFDRARSLWARVAPRLESLCVDLDRVLVVGTVGGTGTGKSTLLNALVGHRICAAGDVERPTTRRPVVLAHPDVDLSFLQFKENEPEIHRLPLPLLKQMILIDCPDPDTQGRNPIGNGAASSAQSRASENRNLEVLRRVLPNCDVLLYVGTAQKYKTEAVAGEVFRHAPGRQVVFIQTHAAIDPDITSDWQRHLEAAGFEVPRMFRLDGEEALERAEQRLPPPPEFSRLVEFLHQELAGRARHRILRANALDLLEWFLQQAQSDILADLPQLIRLGSAIPEQREILFESVRAHLEQQLRGNQGVWRARLLRDVTLRWSWGPFAAFVRVLGTARTLLRFAPALRARGLAPMLVAGGLGVGKAVADRVKESLADDRWMAAAELGINTGEVARANSVLAGLAHEAGVESQRITTKPTSTVDENALALAATRLYQQVETEVDAAIERRVKQRAGSVFHFVLEVSFGILPAVLLFRLAKDFFYDHLWLGTNTPLLGIDFLVQAALWVVVWGLLLRGWLAWRLQRGLSRDFSKIVKQITPESALGPLFEDFANQVERISNHASALELVRGDARRLRHDLESDGAWQLGRLQHRVAGTPSAP